METITFQETKYEWSELHLYYQNIKKLYNLTSYDVITQLLANDHNDSYQMRWDYIQYLGERGNLRSPSTKKGTCGASMRKLLLSGIFPVIKTDWSPSVATYEQKLSEKRLYGHFRDYSIRVIEKDGKYTNPPELKVGILNKHFGIVDKNQMLELERLFTIDGVVPKVVEIYQMYYLI